MILKVRNGNKFLWIDNLYMVETEKIKKVSVRGTESGNNALWIEGINTKTGKPHEWGFFITAQKYMYEHECRTVKITDYIIDSGYLLNDNGKISAKRLI